MLTDKWRLYKRITTVFPISLKNLSRKRKYDVNYNLILSSKCIERLDRLIETFRDLDIKKEQKLLGLVTRIHFSSPCGFRLSLRPRKRKRKIKKNYTYIYPKKKEISLYRAKRRRAFSFLRWFGRSVRLSQAFLTLLPRITTIKEAKDEHAWLTNVWWP